MAKRFTIIAVLILLIISLTSLSASAQTETALDISGIPVRVISEYRPTKTHTITVVIPTPYYARESIEKIWRHYCETNLDTKDRLYLIIYTNESYQHNQAYSGLPVDMHTNKAILPDGTKAQLRSYEAIFERSEKGGRNQLLIEWTQRASEPSGGAAKGNRSASIPSIDRADADV
jgi:hypothetical protein